MFVRIHLQEPAYSVCGKQTRSGRVVSGEIALSDNLVDQTVYTVCVCGLHGHFSAVQPHTARWCQLDTEANHDHQALNL